MRYNLELTEEELIEIRKALLDIYKSRVLFDEKEIEDKLLRDLNEKYKKMDLRLLNKIRRLKDERVNV